MNGRLLCFLLACCLLGAPGAGAQQVKLRATLQAPLSNPFYGVSVARLKEEVEKQSNGDIIIEIFDKSQLFREDEALDAVSSGAIDIGITALHQFANRVPAAAFLNQPFLFNFEALWATVVRPESELRKLIDDGILAETGMRILWWQSLGDHVIYSQGPDVADVGRLKGQKVGVPGKGLSYFIARCGGIPSVIGIEEINGALKDGSITMTVAGIAAVDTREFWKVTNNITRTLHAPLELFLAINEKRWQSLSPEHRALIASAARSVERETSDRLAELQAKGYAFAVSKGMKVQNLSPDQVAEWRACTADLVNDFMDMNGAIARQLMDAYAKLRTDPCCASAPGAVAFSRR